MGVGKGAPGPVPHGRMALTGGGRGAAAGGGGSVDNGLIALGAAVVGVAGTLLATVLSQRMMARVQAAQFDREQRVAHARWLREQELAELARRRVCYAASNAAYRRYRIALMYFLWLVHKAQVTRRSGRPWRRPATRTTPLSPRPR